jgi:hypothetical protein
MDRIQAQSVDMALFYPVEGVFNKIAPDFIAVRAVKIEGHAPGGAIPVREIGPELPQVVTLGTKMVVYDVQDYGQSLLMACVHQALEPIGPSIRILNRKRVRPIVAPVAVPRKLGHWHKLNRRNAQIREPVKVTGDNVKTTLRCIGADVQFINYVFAQRQAGPGAVFPGKTGFDYLRRTVDPMRLRPGGRIGKPLAPIEQIEVLGPWPHSLKGPIEIASIPFGQGQQQILGQNDLHIN